MKEKTHIVLVLDESSSMSNKKNEVIISINNFLAAQRELPGEASITFITFSTEPRVLYSNIDIKQAPDLRFNPNGMTALLDAVGLAINTTKEQFKNGCSNCRPDKVLFVILTDGEENVSVTFDKQTIGKLISEVEKENKWNFIYLGANQDAWCEASSFGISNMKNVANFNMDEIEATIKNVNESVIQYRSVPLSDIGENYQAYVEVKEKNIDEGVN